jgi:transcription elongation factor Elf1
MKISDLLTLKFWTFGFFGKKVVEEKPISRRSYGSFTCWLCRTENVFVVPVRYGKFNGNCSYCDLSCEFLHKQGQSDRNIKSVPGTITMKGMNHELQANFR